MNGRTPALPGPAVTLTLAVAPAFAADDHEITAVRNELLPPELEIDPGDRVFVKNDDGVHNFSFADGQALPADAADADDPVWDGANGMVDFGTVPDGPRTLRFDRTASGRRLAPGRSTSAVRIAGAPGRTVGFTVTRPR